MANEDRNKDGFYLDRLKERYSGCSQCEAIVPHRNRLVWGHGPTDAMVMTVAEGPGGEEDREGIPFVGPAGQNLENLLNEVGLTRHVMYVTNAVICRPTKFSSTGKGLTNRPPTTIEIANCRERLISELLYVDPLIVLALGETATSIFLGKRALSKVRGQIVDFTIRTEKDIEVKYPILPTYHPSYLMQYAKQNDIYLTIKDLELLKSVVATYSQILKGV